MVALFSSCTSPPCFAIGFLQIPPRDGHPCSELVDRFDSAYSGLSPPRFTLCPAHNLSRLKLIAAFMSRPISKPQLHLRILSFKLKLRSSNNSLFEKLRRFKQSCEQDALFQIPSFIQRSQLELKRLKCVPRAPR